MTSEARNALQEAANRQSLEIATGVANALMDIAKLEADLANALAKLDDAEQRLGCAEGEITRRDHELRKAEADRARLWETLDAVMVWGDNFCTKRQRERIHGVLRETAREGEEIR